MGVNAKWFKDHLAVLEISQRQFSKKLKIDPSSLTLFFQGKRRLKSEEAALVARLFGVDIAEVLSAAGVTVTESPKTPGIAIKGVVGEHLRVELGKVSGSRVARFKEPIKGIAAALRCETAGTGYDGLDGALVIYREREGIDPEAVGRLAVVWVKGGGVLLRVLRRGYGVGRWNLAMIEGRVAETDIEVERANAVLQIRV